MFVRWGNATAPAGTTVAYSGFVFSGYYGHSGTGTTLCLAAGNPGIGAGVATQDLLYPARTATSGFLPPGIPNDVRLKCAVAHVDGPTAVVWGSSQAPVGWEVVYAGYSFGAHYTHPNPMDRICVDNLNFDGSVPGGPFLDALYYATNVQSTGNLSGSYVAGTGVRCAVVVKK